MVTATTEQRVFKRGLNSEEDVLCFALQMLSFIINRNIGSNCPAFDTRTDLYLHHTLSHSMQASSHLLLTDHRSNFTIIERITLKH